MVLKDLIGPTPTPAAERPPRITCEKYTRGNAFRLALRASVGSTEASDGRLARVGLIDRRYLGPFRFGVVGPKRAVAPLGERP
jgi:hypothetical protein